MMKKLITFLIVMLLNFHFANSQYVWQQKTSFPMMRYGGSSFTINNYAYLGTGYSSSTVPMGDLWRYDAINDIWTQMASMTTPRSGAISFSINGMGYIGLGINSNGHLNDLHQYDPVSNSWSPKTSIPVTARYGCASFSIGSYGYIVCGNSGSASGPMSNQTYAYDAITNTWSLKAVFPGNARYGCRAAVVNLEGYVFGGTSGTGSSAVFYKDFWKYDPITNDWNQLADIPGNGRQYPSVFAIDNMIVAGNGVNLSGYLSDFFAYDPSLGAWNAMPSLPANESRWAACSYSVGSDGYVTGGNQSLNNPTVLLNTHWKLVNTTAVNEINSENLMIKIYPNPAKENIFIDLVSKNAISPNYEIFNGNGAMIQSGQLMEKNKIDIQQFANGIYFVKITNENKSVSFKKFVVLN